ncbi:hypothetical protein Tco_0867271, partial [Tanacetum coccineum]
NPLDDLPSRYCTCERCGYDNRGLPCLGCNSETENSFTYEPTPYSYNDSPNLINPPPSPRHTLVSYVETIITTFLIVYYDSRLGPHETFQCQPMNQNYYEPNPCYNYNSSGFDQFQPPQYSVVHQPPQETSTEMLQARENLMEAIQAFLKKYDQIPPKDKSMALLLAEERFLKIKQDVEEEQNQPKNIQELLLKLINDLQTLNGIQLKQEEQIAKESSIPLRDIISELTLSVAITPDLPITDSLIMEDEHLNTILETESDEENDSSVEDLVPILKNIESKDSYVSNLDEPALLVTPLSNANEDECFDPGGDIDEINAFLDMDISTDIKDGYYDSEGDIIYLESLLINDTIPILPPEVFLDHDPTSLKDEPNINDLKIMVKIFDPRIHEKKFSPTYVSLTFEDHHYLSFIYVIRIFLPYFTYPVVSPFLLSSGSEISFLTMASPLFIFLL